MLECGDITNCIFIHFFVDPIPESGTMTESHPDAVSELCQQVSAGLSLLSSFSRDNFSHGGAFTNSIAKSPPSTDKGQSSFFFLHIPESVALNPYLL